MALVKICDICGEECSKSSVYELIKKGVLRDYKHDICCDCVGRIKREIEDNRRK